MEGRGRQRNQEPDTTCPSTEGSPLAKSNFPSQPQSTTPSGRGTGRLEIPLTRTKLSLSLSHQLCGCG